MHVVAEQFVLLDKRTAGLIANAEIIHSPTAL
jgi:hypothetical protein